MASVEKRERTSPGGKTKLTWLARWRDPSGQQRKRSFSKRVDAERYLTNVRSGMLDGSYVDPGRSLMTVGEWSRTWMAGRVDLKAKTLADYQSLLKTRVLPRWATVPLAKVSHADAVAWVARMRAGGLSASRTRQAYHLLKSMLDDAVKDRRLTRNPVADLDLPRLPTASRRYLDHHQLAALADACGDYRLLVLVLGYCGLRWGELAALRTRNVDLLRRRFEIVEAVTEVNGALVLGTPKTHQRRSVSIPRFLAEQLTGHLAGKAADDLVFTSPRGGMLRNQNFRRSVWDEACKAVGLAGLVPHELRHTAASLAIASGADVKGVQMMLGHASATLTLDRYGHLFPDQLDAVADRLDEARTKAGVPPVCPTATVTDLRTRVVST